MSNNKTNFLRTTKLHYGEFTEIEVDESHLWVNEVLGELVDELGGELSDNIDCTLKWSFKAKRFQHHTYREGILVEGQISAVYPASCSKSGDQLEQNLSVSMRSVFIDSSFEDNEELAEEITLFIEDQEWDLYYHQNGLVDLKPVLHEYIFLNRNPYPGND